MSKPTHASEPFRFDIRWTPHGNEIIGNPNGKYIEAPTPATASDKHKRKGNMNLITKKSDARGALRNAGWSDKDILDVIPLASTTREPLAVGANDSMAATFQPSATPATDCTCHADAYCKIHGNTPATASEQGAGYRLAKLLRDEYWAQTPLDVAKLADEVLSQA